MRVSRAVLSPATIGWEWKVTFSRYSPSTSRICTIVSVEPVAARAGCVASMTLRALR